MRNMWELKQSTSPDTLELYIYDDVESDSFNWWTGEVVHSETSANHFREALAAHPNAQYINIYINSYGGSVFEGTAIYTQLKRHAAYKTVYVDGFACSIASVIAMAGDKVVMPRNTMMMIHNMWSYTAGNSAQLRKAADDLDVINQAGRQAYLEKAGEKMSEEILAQLMDAETWLTAEDCIRYGLADEYAQSEADLTKATGIQQKVNLHLEQHIAIQKSLCAQLRQLMEPLLANTQDPVPEVEPAAQQEKLFFNFGGTK